MDQRNRAAGGRDGFQENGLISFPGKGDPRRLKAARVAGSNGMAEALPLQNYPGANLTGVALRRQQPSFFQMPRHVRIPGRLRIVRHHHNRLVELLKLSFSRLRISRISFNKGFRAQRVRLTFIS